MANNPNLNEVSKGTQFSSTNQPANNGRKPSRLKKFIKENNLGAEDVSLIIKQIMAMNQPELEAIIEDETKPMLVRLFVKSFLQDFLKSRLTNWEALMRRAYGDPEQFVTMKEDPLELAPSDREKIIEELLKKRGNK